MSAKVYSKTFLLLVLIKGIDVIKNLVIASQVGVSNSADIFMAISAIPEGLVVLVGIDSLRGVVNSEYSSLYSKGERDSLHKSFNNLFKMLLATGLIMLGLIMLFKSQLIDLLLPGFDAVKKVKANEVATIIFPTIIIKVLMALLQSVYNSFKKFTFPIIVQSFNSIAVLISILFPVINNDIIFNLSYGIFAGNLMTILVMLLWTNRINLKFKFDKFEFDPVTKTIIKSCSTILVVVFINQLYFYSRNYFASEFGDGAISSLGYAATIPTSIMVITFGAVFSVLLSDLATNYAVKKKIDAKNLFLNNFIIIFYLFIPIVIFLIIFREEVLKLVYLRGNLNLEDIGKIEKPFIWESVGLLSWITFTIPTSLFLAKKEYKWLMILGSICYAMGIGLNYVLTGWVGYYGISISTVITLGVYGIVLFYYARKFLGRYGRFIKNVFLLLLTGAVTFVIIQILFIMSSSVFKIDNLLLRISYLTGGGLLVLGTYFLLSMILKVNYLKSIFNLYKA